MAKVPFSKLDAKPREDAYKLYYTNLKDEDIYYEVKCYLPLQEKMALCSRIINQSVDDNGFYNPMLVKFNMVLEIVYAYTNLSFTAKQKENPYKLYDILVGTGIFKDIINYIREEDWAEIKENVWMTIDNIYKYRNSAMGILESISNDYSQLDLDATAIRDKIGDPQNLDLLRDVLSKLG